MRRAACELPCDPRLRFTQFSERGSEQRAEHDQRAERWAGNIEHEPRLEREQANKDEKEDRGGEQQRRIGRPYARHEQDEDEAGNGKQRRLDQGGAGRAAQVHAVEDLLEDLGVDLDARNALAERGGLEVEQAEAGYADQHQFVAQQLRRRLAAQHVLGGHEAPGVVRPEVGPQRAVGLHRDRQVAEHQRDTLAAAVFDAQAGDAGGDANHLHRQRGCHDLADARHQRHAADHAVGRIDAEQPAAGGGAVDLVAGLQVPREAPQRQLARARLEHWRGFRRMREAPVAVFEAGDAQHDLAAFERLRQRGVGARRGAVGLDEQQVDPDRRRAGLGDGAHQFGDHGARPGPLAARLERRLVDLHDHRRCRGAAARQQLLVGIEQRLAPERQPRQVEREDEDAGCKYRRAERARARAEAQSSISRPS